MLKTIQKFQVSHHGHHIYLAKIRGQLNIHGRLWEAQATDQEILEHKKKVLSFVR